MRTFHSRVKGLEGIIRKGLPDEQMNSTGSRRFAPRSGRFLLEDDFTPISVTVNLTDSSLQRGAPIPLSAREAGSQPPERWYQHASPEPLW